MLYQSYPEKPNFTDWTKGSIIKFSRDQDNGKWNREVLPDSVAFNLWNATPDVVEKVQKENEDITTSELFREPTDDQTLKVQQILESIKADIIAKKAASTTTETTTDLATDPAPVSAAEPVNNGGFGVDDNIPF